MKTLLKIIVFTGFLSLTGCNKDEDPKKIECGCESEPEAILSNINGKIEFHTFDKPISYTIYGNYGTGLMVCVDSTFNKLLDQKQIGDGDSIVFSGGGKDPCFGGCEYCDPLGFISITSLSKK